MQRDLKEKVASLFELPGDLLLDVARITLVGEMQVLVENHRGLLEYNPGRVTLSVPKGRVSIEGEELSIGSISPDAVTIHGRVLSLKFGQ